jgi:hypothetical protein
MVEVVKGRGGEDSGVSGVEQLEDVGKEWRLPDRDRLEKPRGPDRRAVDEGRQRFTGH